MLKRTLRGLAPPCLALCLLLVLPARASAWSKPGHRMIAEIARWRLRQLKATNAIARVDAILRARLGEPMLMRPRAWSTAVVWPDEVRASEEYCYADNTHFASIPLGPDAGPDKFDAATQCRPNAVGVSEPGSRCKPTVGIPEGVCSVGGLEHFTAVLEDGGSSRKARLEAVSFILHLVGDMHQPLHNSEDEDFRNHTGKLGDRGGNFQFVCYFNEAVCTSPDENSCFKHDLRPGVKVTACTDVFGKERANKKLHATWDNYLIQSEMEVNPRRRNEAAYVRDLLKSLPKNPKAAFYADAEGGTFADWAEESHELAQRHAYLKNPRRKKSPADNEFYDFYFVSRQYQAENIKVVDRQLIRGGLRLAAHLKKIFP